MTYDRILTTAHSQKVSASGVILAPGEGAILTKQQVVAAGPTSVVKKGEWVEIDPNKFPKKRIKARYDIGPDSEVAVPPIEIIDGEQYLLISTRELKYIYED